MNFGEYLKDKVFYLASFAGAWLLSLALFGMFQVNSALMITMLTLEILMAVLFVLYGYRRKRVFYRELFDNIKGLDKAYLVLETLETPSFYEGRLLCDALYEIDRSMCERVQELEETNRDFREYIEMWIHEVKIPLAALLLQAHNHRELFDRTVPEQLKRIDDYVEQVLYYARSETAEQDYRIGRTELAKVVKAVALKSKDDLLERQIELIVQDVDRVVWTDAKWLEFILHQIVSNSIKYRREEGDSRIRICAQEGQERVKLRIWDNGIGIAPEDIGRVFDQSFTGYNGRLRAGSTGMGLYIVRKLCRKLGHEISVQSEQGAYTELCITFCKDRFYSVVTQ